jgi:Ca2+-binding EF-hand superfamily protein
MFVKYKDLCLSDPEINKCEIINENTDNKNIIKLVDYSFYYNFVSNKDPEDNNEYLCIYKTELKNALCTDNKDNLKRDIFDIFDTNKNGSVSRKELKEVFDSIGIFDEEINKIIKLLDFNGDNDIFFPEFMISS